ncbi:hypothetical protein ACFZBP_34685 [Streptomyces sp. NPDC008086]|uniref:hypothetical protein n=1 Tax=Streptomyces sp. NPDC008086 TaxID=3364807 RepID=UPI0036EAC558
MPTLRPIPLFDDVLKDVLTEPEFGGVSEPEAQAGRDAVLERTQDAQVAYEQAVTRTRLEARLRRRLVAAGAVVLLIPLAMAVTSGWSDALKDALPESRSVSVWSVAGDALGGFLAFLALPQGWPSSSGGAITFAVLGWGWVMLGALVVAALPLLSLRRCARPRPGSRSPSPT